MEDVLFYQNYVFVGDICAMALCAISWFLLMSTYSIRQKNLIIFHIGNSLVFSAAIASILYQSFVVQITPGNVWLVYFLRDAKLILLVLTYVIFNIYIMNLMELSSKTRKIIKWVLGISFALFFIVEVTLPFTKIGFHIDEQLQVHENYYRDVFWLAYAFYSVILMLIFFSHRKKFITKIFNCICKVFILSVAVIALEVAFRSNSFTCITFAFPVIVALFLFHHNAYDTQTGTLDSQSFDNYIDKLGTKKFGMIMLYLHDMNPDKFHDLSVVFFHFNERFFHEPCTFRLRDNKLALIYEQEKNPNASEILEQLLNDFKSLYNIYRIDYRIVLMNSDERIESGLEYKELDDFIETKMQMNTIHQCEENDIEDYLETKYIYHELKDISDKMDLEDERVLVYCQPVYNTETESFSSAEALMRLSLPETGMCYPDVFIPIAERFDFIHSLSLIILNKTCKAIHEFEVQGFKIDRVSVNFAIVELRDPNFTKDILHIISDNKISYDKIAVELTESKNETDFKIVKKVMTGLQELGVKFYLDDFGTGYSNFERLTELPIDIVKFDRSLTILAGKSEDSKHMIGSFSEIFKRSNYQILFEGIEDITDEQICKEMNAQYLQGYKYSRPIPIEQLNLFLSK